MRWMASAQALTRVARRRARQALLDETAAADALERQYCVPLDFAGANTAQARPARATRAAHTSIQP